MPLTPYEVLAVLFGRAEPGTFHWSICIPISPRHAIKLHAKSVGNDHWFFESDTLPQEDLESSPIIAVAVRLGQLLPEDLENVVQLLKAIPMVIPEVDQAVEGRFTCRVWFKEAVRVLNQAGYVRCDDVGALEKECKEYALANDPSGEGWKGHVYLSSKQIMS